MDNHLISDILNNVLKKSKFYGDYLGIFSIDDFNNLKIYIYDKFSLILFIDNIFKNNLGHWIVISKSNKGRLYFLDSYGKNPEFYRKKIEKKFDFYLNIRLQSDFSTICGGYAIFFIDLISKCSYDMMCFIMELPDF